MAANLHNKSITLKGGGGMNKPLNVKALGSYLGRELLPPKQRRMRMDREIKKTMIDQLTYILEEKLHPSDKPVEISLRLAQNGLRPLEPVVETLRNTIDGHMEILEMEFPHHYQEDIAWKQLNDLMEYLNEEDGE
jgi:hypothetical protein